MRDFMSEQGRWELWFDRHKRVMEFLRTLTSGVAGIASTIVLMKVW